MMNAPAGAIHHHHVDVVHVSHRVHDPIPDTRVGPAVEAVIDGCAGAVFAGQVAPRHARAQHVENTIDDAPVIDPFYTSGLVWKNLFDGNPIPNRPCLTVPFCAPARWLSKLNHK